MNIAREMLLQWGPHGPHAPMGPYGGGAGMGVWGGGMGMGTGVGLLWWVVVLALVVGVVVAAAVLLRRDETDDGTGALAVLRERYAAGDIDDEEFERRWERLNQQMP